MVRIGVRLEFGVRFTVRVSFGVLIGISASIRVMIPFRITDWLIFEFTLGFILGLH